MSKPYDAALRDNALEQQKPECFGNPDKAAIDWCSDCEYRITCEATRKPSALSSQVAGSHYKDMPIQPVEFIYKNSIGYLEGNVIKYVARHRLKNGIEDLNKAEHYLQLIKELHYGVKK